MIITWLNIPQLIKLGNLQVCEKLFEDKKHNSVHLVEKYSRTLSVSGSSQLCSNYTLRKLFASRIRTNIWSYFVPHGSSFLYSLRSRREWVPAQTSVPNASAKSCAGREKNVEESSWIIIFAIRDNQFPRSLTRISGFTAKSFARAPTPASYTGYSLYYRTLWLDVASQIGIFC